MVKQVDAVQRFLIKSTQLDLAELYNRNMEVQVNVARDSGDRIEGEYQGHRWNGWTDGIETWKSFRIPYNANTDPRFEDKDLTFNLENHVEGIGMTGWDFHDKCSRWVAFDFDAIIGHSDKHSKKLSDIELKEIETIVSSIPWITLRRSTSGKGLHLYVFLDAVPTSNHNEHSALSRAILGMLSAVTGFDFKSKVDICGGNMWVWHRKMLGTNGLILIKQGETLFDIPINWRDHISVVSGRKKRSVPGFIEQSEVSGIEGLFEELSGQRSRIKLDEDHKKLIDYLQTSNANWWWDQDHHMLVTHTYHLKEAHKDLNLKGVFETLSTGRERGVDHNCYAWPMRSGAWAVRRYNPGVKEADTWDQDGNGWTRCFFNQEPDLKTAARLCGGNEDPSGGFVFREAEMAIKAAAMIGTHVSIPNALSTRGSKLKEHKDGRLIIEVEKDDRDAAISQDLGSWLPKKGNWVKIFNVKSKPITEAEVGNYDDVIRHLVTESNEDYGWVIKSEDSWRNEPLEHVKLYLQAIGLDPKEIREVLGASVSKCWTLVNQPFQPEYVGDRKWNRDSAQLRFVPSENKDSLSYPNWINILNHCGQGLNEAVKQNPWAKANGILTGGDYLKCWIASLFQAPTEPLPYLFLYGSQDCGKSILHEAISLLISKGVNRADNALINQSGFNAEIEYAILCVIEETDLARNKMAYNRIKDWVTSRQLPIHRKGQTPYTIINTTHWLQCSNSRDFCPVFPGDARITVINVADLDPLKKIPKRELLQLLEKEAPDFLAAIMGLEIPNSNDRLNVPVITTQDKVLAEESNRSFLEIFLDEFCHRVPGKMIKYGEFYSRFKEWMDPNHIHHWSQIRVGKELPRHIPKGRWTGDSQWYLGNISWEPLEPGEPEQPEFKLSGQMLVINARPQENT